MPATKATSISSSRYPQRGPRREEEEEQQEKSSQVIWRGSARFRLQGDQEMLNFQVGHEVQIAGPIVENADASRPAGMKVESILYLSRTCWKRGTTTEETARPKR